MVIEQGPITKEAAKKKITFFSDKGKVQ